MQYNKKAKIKYFLLFLTVYMIIFILWSTEKNYKINAFLERKSLETSSKYNAIYNQYKVLSETIFLLNINTDKVLTLFKDAGTKDKQKQNNIRNALYKTVSPTHKMLKKHNIKQLHFHLKDNTSFLRIHKPETFGDDLTGIRETVAYVNKNKRKVDSFEEGRVYNGYRFVFPLFYKQDHIGSVEISFSALAFHEMYFKDYGLESNLFISKNIVDKKVFKMYQKYYIPSEFKGLYYEKTIYEYLNARKPDMIHTIEPKHSRMILENVYKDNTVSFFDKPNKMIQTVIPLKNKINNKIVGFYVSYDDKDMYIIDKNKNHLIVSLIVFVLLAFIFYFIYRNAIMNTNLITLNKNLKVKIQEVNASNIVAQNAYKAKSEFLAIMSHEIRTPMNAILSISFLLKEMHLSSTIRTYVQKIDNAATHLLSIINDILDFSKIESGKMTLESADFCFNDILEKISDMFMIKCEEKDLKLWYDLDPKMPYFMIGDSLRLLQVLINIVGNAVKFTEHGSIVLKTQVLSISQQEAHVKFTVTDTGIGMTDAQVNKIFLTYGQADSTTTRNYGGSGLGLSISKYFVEQMCGTIKVNSKYRQGSEFIFDIKIKLQKEQQLFTLDPVKNVKVLIVNENTTESHIMLKILKLFHCETSSVMDSQDVAKTILEEDQQLKPFDLVMIDQRVSNMSGNDLANTIKNKLSLKKQPKLLLLSTNQQMHTITKSTNRDIDMVLLKPLYPSNVYNAIVSIFNKSEYAVSSLNKTLKTNFKTFVPNLSGAHILIVEDNIQNIEIAVKFLEKGNMTSDIAKNGEEAIDMVLQREYDAVLMDCQMPVMDGYDATRNIRELTDEEKKSIPIIAMTANAIADDKVKCHESGMDDYLSKPIDIHNMFKTLSKYILSKQDSLIKTIDEKSLVNDAKYKELALDVRDALTRMGDDDVLYRSQLEIFLKFQKDFQHRVEALFNKQDKKALVRAFHTLKGLCANIGEKNLRLKSTELEIQLNDAITVQTKELAEEIFKDLDALMAGIENFLAKNKKVQSDSLNVLVDETLHIKLQLLESLLTESDTQSIDLFLQLKASLEAKSYKEECQKIEELIENFDFKNALGALQTLRKSIFPG